MTYKQIHEDFFSSNSLSAHYKNEGGCPETPRTHMFNRSIHLVIGTHKPNLLLVLEYDRLLAIR